MSFADEIAKGLISKLEEDTFDKKKDANIKNEQIELIPKNQHQLVFTYEKRNGKSVTIVGRFYIKEEEKKQVLKLLKTKLACGGTINKEYIEIQGNIKEKIKDTLIQNGWKFK